MGRETKPLRMEKLPIISQCRNSQVSTCNIFLPYKRVFSQHNHCFHFKNVVIELLFHYENGETNGEYSMHSLLITINILVCSHAVLVLSINNYCVLHSEENYLYRHFPADTEIPVFSVTLLPMY